MICKLLARKRVREVEWIDLIEICVCEFRARILGVAIGILERVYLICFLDQRYVRFGEEGLCRLARKVGRLPRLLGGGCDEYSKHCWDLVSRGICLVLLAGQGTFFS